MAWNLPRRSTTQALCCGTTRTPSITNTIATASMKNGMVKPRVCSNCERAMVAIRTAMNFGNMGILPSNSFADGRIRGGRAFVCIAASGLGLRYLERIAVHGVDEQHLAVIERALALDLRIPQRIAILYPRGALFPVHPGVERDRLTQVERRHVELRHGLAILLYPEHAGDRHRRSAQCLHPES